MTRRVLVTGATGFIGRGTLEPLLRAGYEVHATTSRGAHPDAPGEVTWHRTDLLSCDARAELVERVTATDLLHFAWYAEPDAFWSSPLNEQWSAASLGLLHGFAAAGGTRVVMAGSCAEYAWTDYTECVEGSTPLEPATVYGVEKNRLREAAEREAAELGISFAWGRIFFVYGPHEDPRRLVSSVARAVLDGRRAETSHGRQERDFIYAPDLAAAFVSLLRSDVTGALNLASGEVVTIADVVTRVAAEAGAPELLDLGARPAPAGEPSRIAADVSRLRDEVAWSGARSLDEGVALTVRWWRGAIDGLRPEPA